MRTPLLPSTQCRSLAAPRAQRAVAPLQLLLPKVLLPPCRCSAGGGPTTSVEEPRSLAQKQQQEAAAATQLPSADVQRLAEEQQLRVQQEGEQTGLGDGSVWRSAERPSSEQRRAARGADLPAPAQGSYFSLLKQPGEQTGAYAVRLARRFAGRVAQRFSKLEPGTLLTSLFFVLGVILVNYGVESMLDFYLGDSPLGSIGCILMGAGVLTYLRIMRIPVAKTLLQVFLN